MDNQPRITDIDEMINFLKVFVDQCHHGKEEQIFFPRLETDGVPKEGGPIGVMIAEHEQGRGYIRNMRQAAVDYKAGNTSATVAFVEDVADYIYLMEQHINKENTVLFVMADKLLTEKVQEELFDKFEVLEDKVIGRGKHEELHRLFERLSNSYIGYSGNGQQ